MKDKDEEAVMADDGMVPLQEEAAGGAAGARRNAGHAGRRACGGKHLRAPSSTLVAGGEAAAARRPIVLRGWPTRTTRFAVFDRDPTDGVILIDISSRLSRGIAARMHPVAPIRRTARDDDVSLNPPIITRRVAVMDLSSLIHPVSPQTFKIDYWEKQPLRIPRNNPIIIADCCLSSTFDRVLSLSSIQPSQVRVVRAGKETPVGMNGACGLIGTAGRLEEVYGAYRDGATIVLQFLHERLEPLRRLCQSLAAEFSANFQVNIYLTPGQERGLNVHYDLHDVFVLQSEGVKHWWLYEVPIRLPLRGQPYNSRTMKPGALLQEFDLRPGDLLYIPRGWMHAAESHEAASLHLTVGVNTVTWASVILRAVEAVIERDERWRASLPLGFAREPRLEELAVAELRSMIDRLGDAIDAPSAVREAVAEARLGRQPALEGHLLDLQGGLRDRSCDLRPAAP